MQSHTPETKAAVLADVVAGESVAAVARKYGIGRNTIRVWTAELGDHGSSAIQQKKEAIGEKVYGLVEDNVETLRKIAKHAQKDEWLDKQTANDLAVFMGVMQDKTVRLLSAFRPPEDNE
jgi:transposase-like protein